MQDDIQPLSNSPFHGQEICETSPLVHRLRYDAPPSTNVNSQVLLSSWLCSK